MFLDFIQICSSKDTRTRDNMVHSREAGWLRDPFLTLST